MCDVLALLAWVSLVTGYPAKDAPAVYWGGYQELRHMSYSCARGAIHHLSQDYAKNIKGMYCEGTVWIHTDGDCSHLAHELTHHLQPDDMQYNEKEAEAWLIQHLWMQEQLNDNN